MQMTRNAFERETANEIFVTVNPSYSEECQTYPLSVYVRQVGNQGREGSGVQVRDMNHAYTYANGVNDGLMRAGQDSLPIRIDERLVLQA